MNTMKRLYFYGVAFVSLVMTASGVSLLLRYLVDLALSRTLAGSSVEQVSLGLAMVVVGAPLWAFHWTYTQRQVVRQPEEAGAVLRKLYIYGAMFLAAAVAFATALSLLRWVFESEDFQAMWAGQLVAVGLVWWYHWLVERREGQPLSGGRTVRRWYVYVTAVYALVAFGIGIGTVMGVLFSRAYDGLVGASVMAPDAGLWGPAMKDGLASALIGGTWWAFHWLYLARGDVESTLRQVYLYLLAFLGGAVTMLVSGAILIYTVLHWAVRAPELPAAAQHFQITAGVLSAILVGAALLAYHWQVVREESQKLAGRLPGARRSFGYIMSGLGVGSLASGATVLLGLLVGLAVPAAREPLVNPEAWRNPLALALTLLIIGVPLWYWYWTRMQRQAQGAGAEERSALPRRIYVYGILGILALAALGSLIALLAMLLSHVLKGEFNLDFLRNGKWALGVVVTAGALLPYHWQVLREDQRAGAEAVPAKKSVTLVIGKGADEVVAKLEKALGTRIRVVRVVWPQSVAPVLSDDKLELMVKEVQEAPSDQVMLIAAEGAIRVYGYK